MTHPSYWFFVGVRRYGNKKKVSQWQVATGAHAGSYAGRKRLQRKQVLKKKRGYICGFEKKSLLLHSDNRKNNNIKYQGNEKNIPTFKQKKKE